MRRLLYLFLILFMVLSCERQETYNISIENIDGAEDSVSLYVYESVSKNIRKINYGIISSDSTLNLSGNYDNIERLAFLKLGNDSSVCYFVLDNIPTEFYVSKEGFKLIEGSQKNYNIQDKLSVIKSLSTGRDSLKNLYNSMLADTTLSALKEEEILKDYKLLKDSLQEVLMETVNVGDAESYIIWRECGNLMHPDSVAKIKNKADYIK